jgi:hypothetical protein
MTQFLAASSIIVSYIAFGPDSVISTPHYSAGRIRISVVETEDLMKYAVRSKV